MTGAPVLGWLVSLSPVAHAVVEYTNEALSIAAVAVALAYLWRVVNLNIWDHSPLFCVQNAGCLCVSGYSAFVFWEFGVYPMPIMATILCGVIYFTSQKTYIRETQPADLDQQHQWVMSRG